MAEEEEVFGFLGFRFRNSKGPTLKATGHMAIPSCPVLSPVLLWHWPIYMEMHTGNSEVDGANCISSAAQFY